MKSIFKPLLLSVLLASTGVVAVAHAEGQGRHHGDGATSHHGPKDMAAMQERMAKRQAEFKAKLQLNQAQEPDWANYVAAMQPPPDMAARMSRENRTKMYEEMQALTTPQRIDRMNTMKAQRDARMAERNAATKAFYATLTPDQQKVFDDNAMRGHKGMGHHGGGKHHRS